MNQILITGGTGLVGSRLARQLANVVVSSRNATTAKTKLGDAVEGIVEWDYTKGLPDLTGLQLQAVVNLMGESVAKGRWTAEKKKRIRDSRITATKQLVQAVESLDQKPEVVVSASAVGYYGDQGESTVDETHAVGNGFLAELADEWEKAAMAFQQIGVRLVILRIGVVLSSDGGALAEMLPLF